MENTNEPKLTKRYDADMNLDDFNFIYEDTKLDFSDYLSLNSDYSFYSNNPIPMSAAAITELVLQNQSNHKKYFFTLVSDDCNHALYITDKPFKGTYCSISDSENANLFSDMAENRSALFKPDSDEELQETENEGLLPAVKTIVYLCGLSKEAFKKVNQESEGMKVSDFLTKYYL